MSKRINASLCVDDIFAASKSKHSAFTKSEKNGKVYMNVTVWVNDDKDQFGNDSSVQLNSKGGSTEQKVYIGNGRSSGINDVTPAAPQNNGVEDLDGLPF